MIIGGYFYDLHIPSLEEIRKNFSEDLATSYENVECSIIMCPNLMNEPFSLISRGLCGNVMVADVGGIGNLIPYPKLNKIYDIIEIVKLYNKPEAFVFGAGAGPFHKVNSNCEMVPMLKFENNEVFENKTLLALLRNKENYTFETNLTEFGILGQFHCSEGIEGQVLKISVSIRKKEVSIVSLLQDSLNKHYSKNKNPVYVTGIILMETGTAKIHVMSDFVNEPLDSDAKVNDWLRFFNVQAPFLGFAVIASHDPMNLGLRLEHCHGFSTDRKMAGHFHGDVTPDIVKYTAYIVVAERCLRQDRI